MATQAQRVLDDAIRRVQRRGITRKCLSEHCDEVLEPPTMFCWKCRALNAKELAKKWSAFLNTKTRWRPCSVCGHNINAKGRCAQRCAFADVADGGKHKNVVVGSEAV